MEPLITFGETVVLVVVGLGLRFLIALVGLALIVAPFVVVFWAVRNIEGMRERAHGLAHVGRLMWRQGLLYASGHTWVSEEGPDVVKVGIDDLAQHVLPGLLHWRVAEAGATVYQGQVLAEAACASGRAYIASPIDGTVVSVNADLERHPALPNKDPYGRGWLAMIAPVQIDYERLRTGDVARQWFAREDTRLSAFFERELGVAAADGGEFIEPAPALLTPECWRDLTIEFLGTAPPQ